VHPVAPQHFLGGGDAGAVHQASEGAQACGFGEGEAGAVFVADIGLHEAGLAAQFRRHGFTRLRIEVGEHHLGALFDQVPRSGRSQAGASAGHHKDAVSNFHVSCS